MRRNRWSTDESFEISPTPLIDIVFILIIFFLVATTFYSEERDLKVQLPEGSEGQMIPPQGERLVINVRDAGVLVVNNQVLTMDELEAQLREMAKRPNPQVEIRGDANARHANIMSVMNLCQRTGIHNYALTQRTVRQVD
jgi:biopolymer transport protein ExbD